MASAALKKIWNGLPVIKAQEAFEKKGIIFSINDGSVSDVKYQSEENEEGKRYGKKKEESNHQVQYVG